VANRNWWNYDCPVAFVTPTKPTYATYRYRDSTSLMDENVNEIEGNQVVGNLCIKFHGQELQEPFGVIIKGIKDTYFRPSRQIFTGDGALRDEVGYYRITGRVDDVVIVSGHNLGTVQSRML
jgi:acetyl-CoA synthetase